MSAVLIGIWLILAGAITDAHAAWPGTSRWGGATAGALAPRMIIAAG